MHEFQDQLGFMVAVGGGLLVSMVTSARHSFWLVASRISAGLFCVWVFTDSFVDWAGLSPETYRNSVGALLAMTGYGVVRIFSNISKEDIFDFIKLMRGGK